MYSLIALSLRPMALAVASLAIFAVFHVAEAVQYVVGGSLPVVRTYYQKLLRYKQQGLEYAAQTEVFTAVLGKCRARVFV